MELKLTQKRSKKEFSHPCTIYLVRHGETNWNLNRRLQGWTDIPLNENGKKQALKMYEKLKNIKFDLVISSDLLRAKQTAEIIAKRKKLLVKTTKLIRERMMGKLEGRKFEEIKSKFLDAYLKGGKIRKKFEEKYNVESTEKLMERVIIFIKELALAYQDKTVLVVSHGGTMRMLLVKAGILDVKSQVKSFIENTGYIKVISDGNDIYIDEIKGIKIYDERDGDKNNKA